MEAQTRSVLKKLVAACDAADIPVQLGGSGLLFALGLVEQVRDLDLVFPSEARPALAEVLLALTGTTPEFDADQEQGFMSDWRCQHEMDGQALDMSGGVALEVNGEVVRLPFQPGSVWDLDGTPIPLAPLERWVVIYRVNGSNRADLLAPLVDPAAWERQVRELGPSARWLLGT
jgi:hypothetical protein